jgi:hypothetical protein
MFSMQRSCFTDQQIAFALLQAEQGAQALPGLCLA